MNKNNFDNKLISFNRKITSNKTKYLEVKTKPNNLIIKEYNFFLGRIYITSNDRSQPTHNTSELKKEKITDYILSWKSKDYIILNYCFITFMNIEFEQNYL